MNMSNAKVAAWVLKKAHNKADSDNPRRLAAALNMLMEHVGCDARCEWLEPEEGLARIDIRPGTHDPEVWVRARCILDTAIAILNARPLNIANQMVELERLIDNETMQPEDGKTQPEPENLVAMPPPPYPPEGPFIERMLVQMLRDWRSWAEYVDIADALANVRHHAEEMRRELDHLEGRGEGGTAHE